jgi:hypothetical protein
MVFIVLSCRALPASIVELYSLFSYVVSYGMFHNLCFKDRHT